MKTNLSSKRILLAALVVALTVASLLHRFLYSTGAWQSGAMFIGLPSVLAILIVLLARPKSVTGTVVAGTALFLALSGIVLAEGFICIVLAAPIFLLVAVIVGRIVESIRKRRGRDHTRLQIVALPVVLIMALEGVIPLLEFPRDNTVTRTVEVPADAALVSRRMEEGFALGPELPLFFKLGFPLPEQWDWDGNTIKVKFAGPDRFENVLVLERTEIAPNRMHFRFVEDSTPMPRWLDWKEAWVEWEESDRGGSTVTWTVRYDRSLDPAWYFHPLERYGAGLAAEYLATSLGAP